MKKIINVLIVAVFLIFVNSQRIFADGYDVGYSEWSIEKSDDENEVSGIQYGRKLPLTWSSWSNEVPSSKYQKSRVGNTKHYSYNGENHTWKNTSAKELFTWNFGKSARITYFYADVDTYVSGTWTNYIGPPLYLYCDGTLIRSTGTHNYKNNWNPSVDCNCEILTLSMGNGGGSGRNRTSIVGTWATTTSTEYAYVTSWDEGRDWRFDDKYEELFGEDSQIPTERTVYSYPLAYTINYELDGGTPLGELKTSYTVLDEFELSNVYKKGYDFIGFYMDDKKYTKIEKGSYGNLTLVAKYERKNPTLSVSSYEFIEEDKTIETNKLLELVNAKASDELDGDISDNVKVLSIKYVDDNKTINNPSELDISKAQKIIITFSVINSGDKEVKVTRNFYILKQHVIEDFEKEDIRIYSRYINEEYKGSLDEDSIWNNDDYKSLLENVYQKMKGEVQ